jgi:hypothetical protein
VKNSILYSNEDAGVFNALRPMRPEGERRVAPRYKVRLETRVLIIAEQEAEGAQGEVLPLAGYTRDISESGLALIISGEDMVALSSLGEGYTLRLVLTLPAGPVQLTVTPARYQRLGETEGADFLIGAQIMDMSGRDRVLFMEFIRGLANRA